MAAAVRPLFRTRAAADTGTMTPLARLPADPDPTPADGSSDPGADPPPAPGAAGPRAEAVAALYARHGREVWAVAFGRWLDADLAMDVVHEAFLRYWKQADTGAGAIQNPRAWLLRVARNLAEDHAKSAFRRNGTQPPEHLGGIRSAERPVLEGLERAELFAQVRAVLDELPAADREVLTMRYALDYEAPAIADALGIQVTAVHMRLSRARQRLADKLTALGVTRAP